MKPITFSIVVPTFNSPLEPLRDMFKSIRAQTYKNWELCVVDNASSNNEVTTIIKQYVKKDPRIKFTQLTTNQGIAKASNVGISMAHGEFITFVDHDDTIEPDTLQELVKVIKENPKVDIIYTDEDKINEYGLNVDQYFKSDWNPDLLLSNNYICHLTAYKTSLLNKIKGLREGFEGAQDHDLILRATEQTENIVHIPKILYHWRIVDTQLSKDFSAFDSGRRAIQSALDRRGIRGVVKHESNQGGFRVIREIQGRPLVSIIITTRDAHVILKQCIKSIFVHTLYPNFEVIIVNNNSTDPVTLGLFQDLKDRYKNQITILDYTQPFNFAAIHNFAIPKANGEHILLLNNDTEVLINSWLEAMLEHSQRPEVGAVGTKLLYPDGRVQHAGVILGMNGIADHRFRGIQDHTYPGYFFRKNVIENLSAVTAACIMFRKSVYKEVGGLDAKNLAVAFNDVDFCLKLREKGYLIVYTPYAKAYHYEGWSRGVDTLANRRFLKEVNFMHKKWAKAFQRDPYWPNCLR